MHLPPLIIADAGPLIGLAKVGHLSLLEQLYQTVLIPPTVYTELRPDSDYQGVSTLKAALDNGWLEVSAVPPAELLLPLQQILDPGEAEAIALAQHNTGTSLIIDERRGRRVAIQREIKIIGTGAVLLAAKQRGFIETVREPLLALVEVGYRLSPQLRERLLVMAGEN